MLTSDTGCTQDKRQLERIAVLEAHVANLTAAVAALSHNIESANAKVPYTFTRTQTFSELSKQWLLLKQYFTCRMLFLILSVQCQRTEASDNDGQVINNYILREL